MKLQNQTQKLVQLGFIYCLKNPKNKDIFYVGATESAPKDRLLGHYYHFKEYLKGERNQTPKFKYFEEIFPDLPEIEILEIVQNDYLYLKEIEYIKEYSEKYNLVNATSGGEGGDTFSLQETVNKIGISKLISDKNLGIKRSDEFKKNLSIKRMGKNNPMSNHHNMPMVIAFKDNDLNNPLKLCKAPFEITDFLDSIFGIENHKKHSGRAGNVSKSLRNGNTIVRTSGYVFKTFDTCDKQIQDIVHKDYESNLTEE